MFVCLFVFSWERQTPSARYKYKGHSQLSSWDEIQFSDLFKPDKKPEEIQELNWVSKNQFSILEIVLISHIFSDVSGAITGVRIRTSQKRVSLVLPKHITTIVRNIYFPNTTWRRCLAHTKGKWEGKSIKTNIWRGREEQNEEGRKKKAKWPRVKGWWGGRLLWHWENKKQHLMLLYWWGTRQPVCT